MGVTEDYLPLGGARSVPSESLPRPLGPRAYTARRRGGSTPSLFFFSSRETHHPAPRRARRHSIPLLTHASLCCRLNPCRIQAGTTPGVSAASRAPAASAVALGALLFCSASLNVAQSPAPPRRGPLRLRARPGRRRACSRRWATATAPPGRCTRASRRVPARRGSGWRRRRRRRRRAPPRRTRRGGGGRGCRRRGLVRGGGDGPRAQRADRRERGARYCRKDTWLLSCLFYKADINDELTDWRSVKAECDRERCARCQQVLDLGPVAHLQQRRGARVRRELDGRVRHGRQRVLQGGKPGVERVHRGQLVPRGG